MNLVTFQYNVNKYPLNYDTRNVSVLSRSRCIRHESNSNDQLQVLVACTYMDAIKGLAVTFGKSKGNDISAKKHLDGEGGGKKAL